MRSMCVFRCIYIYIYIYVLCSPHPRPPASQAARPPAQPSQPPRQPVSQPEGPTSIRNHCRKCNRSSQQEHAAHRPFTRLHPAAAAEWAKPREDPPRHFRQSTRRGERMPNGSVRPLQYSFCDTPIGETRATRPTGPPPPGAPGPRKS